MQTVMEALAGLERGVGRRSRQPVHRGTKIMPGQEGSFWQPFDRRDRDRYLKAARQYDRIHRRNRRRSGDPRKIGALGHIAIEVPEQLLNLIDYRTGRLDPAIKTLASRCGHSIGAVVAALKRLDTHGFLKWMRRYVETGARGLRGPQVKQTSNAYQLRLPAAAAGLMPPARPDDEDWRRVEARAQREQYMVDDLRLNGQSALIGGPLGAALGRLAALVPG